MPRYRQNGAYQHCGAVNRRLRPPLAHGKDNLLLPEPIKGVILISKLPGIWRMSGQRRSSRAVPDGRHKPPQIRPRFIDRMGLAISTSRHVDGVWIGSWRSPEDLTRVEGALSLIKQYSPLDYARIIRELERIWVTLAFYGRGQYRHSLRACILDERYMADSATTVEQIASTIVHEATHARLRRYGIEYKEELRTKIEAICFRRQLAFAVRLPNSVELQQEIGRRLEWYQANQGQFSDTQFRENHTAGGAEALRYLGVPDWLIRAVLASRSMIGRARRLSPIIAWAISVPFIVFVLSYAFAAFLDPKAYSKSKPSE